MRQISSRMPVLFVSHGSPMNLVDDNAYTRDLAKLATRLPRPDAIMVISAHWPALSFITSTTVEPKTIHDFYGFPDALYRIHYEPPGAPKLAAHAAGLIGADTDPTRGLDHGAWAVLHYLFPERDIPVFQLSVNMRASFAAHFEVGQKLAPLREQGVMIIGSGNVTHNLRDAIRRPFDAPVVDWTRAFHERFIDLVEHQPEALTRAQEVLPSPRPSDGRSLLAAAAGAWSQGGG